VSATRARIAWDAPAGTAVPVRATAPDGRTLTARKGLLTGLAPGVRYGWVASVGDQARAFGSVTTPPATAGAPVRFITFGDYGAGGEDEWAVARVSAAQGPAFTASLGDNIYLAAAPVLFDRNLFRPLRPLLAQSPLLGVLGVRHVVHVGGPELESGFNAVHPGLLGLGCGGISPCLWSAVTDRDAMAALHGEDLRPLDAPERLAPSKSLKLAPS
jgi:hypothetical protein